MIGTVRADRFRHRVAWEFTPQDARDFAAYLRIAKAPDGDADARRLEAAAMELDERIA